MATFHHDCSLVSIIIASAVTVFGCWGFFLELSSFNISKTREPFLDARLLVTSPYHNSCSLLLLLYRTSRVSTWHGGFLPSSVYPTLYCKEIKVCKNKWPFLSNFVPNSALKNFATASRNSSAVELVDHTYDGRRVAGSWLDTRSLSHVGRP